MRKNILIKNALLLLVTTVILSATALSVNSAFIKPQANDCYYCHRKHYEATTNPSHTTNNYPTKCDTCHRAATGAWRPASSFNHAGITSGCYDCHKARYDSTTNPNHVASGFPTTCDQCHKTNSWKPATFSHTKFPLTGQHATVACAKCHLNGQYTGTSKECYSCHKAKYDATASPKHSTIGLGTTCEQCHNTSNWKPSSWSHANPPASWALTGSHRTLACTSCHVNSQQITGRDCYSCHKARYDATTNPNHVTSGFPTTCQQCHNTTAWKPATFSHTSFPLTGRHTSVECAKCHLNNQYAGTPKDCYTCHWVRTQRDPWKLRLGQTCQQCHNTSAWKPANWSHSSPPASYALTGRHSTILCASCHVNYQPVAGRDCYSCHRTRYESTSNPNHAASGFPTTCQQCHNTSAWRPATFSHTIYPLTGRHATVACASCHPNNRYTGTPRDCYSCHRARYDASANPKHSTIGFGTTCEQCHNTSAWKPSTWSHSSAPASWPLTGFHTTLTCATCHPNSQQLASRTCYSCHKARYDASTNPKHSAAKIGTVCENCHNTTAWTPGKFNHATDAKGAISTRMANNKCNSCHPNNSDYTRNATRCLGCHRREHESDPCARCHYTVAPWDRTR